MLGCCTADSTCSSRLNLTRSSEVWILKRLTATCTPCQLPRYTLPSAPLLIRAPRLSSASDRPSGTTALLPMSRA